MPAPILIEGHNLTLAAGTGIATYARVLASTLRTLGHRTSLLIGPKRGLDAKDPIFNEISVFDAERPPTLLENIDRQLRIAIAAPFGVRTLELPRTGAVVGAGYERLDVFETIHAASHLFENAEYHFRRFGKRLPVRVSGPHPRLFHATHPTPVTVSGCPNVYTIHDLVPLRLPYTTLDDKRYFLRMLREICRTADHIVTVSEASRADIIKMIGVSEDRITNLYQAVQIPEPLRAKPRLELERELRQLFELDYQEYFLFVGALEPKKNVSRLIDAYALSGTRRPLIIAGGLGWEYEDDLEKIEDDRFLDYVSKDGIASPRRRVRRLAYLPFAQLISLMRGARALLFPSIYEGFGLPVLEAMQLGTPVLTSNISSLPEIAGNAALLVDPFDVATIAAGIRKLDQDDDLREELSRQGPERAAYFSPEQYQRRLGTFYARMLG